MAKTMKAAVVREFKKPLAIDEVSVPEVGQGQILVKIEASGVCHTDLHAADGDWPVKPTPPSFRVMKVWAPSPRWARHARETWHHVPCGAATRLI
jgi:threonine dehydrogenase-like Zn-dependent dehydrogenase